MVNMVQPSSSSSTPTFPLTLYRPTLPLTQLLCLQADKYSLSMSPIQSILSCLFTPLAYTSFMIVCVTETGFLLTIFPLPFQFPPAQSHPSILTNLFVPHPSISSPQLHTPSVFPLFVHVIFWNMRRGAMVILGHSRVAWQGKVLLLTHHTKIFPFPLNLLSYIQVPTQLSYKIFFS